MYPSNDSRDYYDVLGLTQESSPSTIKKSYYNLALKWHPDKHNNKKEAANKFNEISEAYSTLIDPRRKEVYDKYGHEGIRRLENNQSPSRSNGTNTFLQKGFCGTDKSAFEFLWDILREESHEFNNPLENDQEEQVLDPFNCTEETPEGFGINFEDFFGQNMNHENEDEGDFGLSEPSFATTELFNPFFVTFEVTENNNNKDRVSNPPQRNQNQWFFSEQDSGRQSPASWSYYQEDLKIEELPFDSLTNKLQEFQSSLNHFHRKLKDNINPEGSLSPNSKKIYKPEKPMPSYFQKRHDVIYT